MSGPPEPIVNTPCSDRVASVNACSRLNKRKIRLCRDNAMSIFLLKVTKVYRYLQSTWKKNDLIQDFDRVLLLNR